MTLPASSARVGIAEISISTTRVCFSSTTLCAIVDAEGHRRDEEDDAEADRDEVAQDRVGRVRIEQLDRWRDAQHADELDGHLASAMIVTPVAAEESATIAASTVPSRTRASASSSVATVVTSSPATSASWLSPTTATWMSVGFAAMMPPMTMLASTMSSRMTDEIRKALLRRRPDLALGDEPDARGHRRRGD